MSQCGDVKPGVYHFHFLLTTDCDLVSAASALIQQLELFSRIWNLDLYPSQKEVVKSDMFSLSEIFIER